MCSLKKTQPFAFGSDILNGTILALQGPHNTCQTDVIAWLTTAKFINTYIRINIYKHIHKGEHL